MYGVLPPRRLPIQDPELILILADRWARASVAHEKWAKIAKECVDFPEGKQWDAETLKLMHAQKRPALTLNKIGRLLRLVLGYFENNTSTIKYLPGHEGVAAEDASEILNMLSQQIDEVNDSRFLNAEMELDGLLGGRGYMDSRICFDDNELGAVKERVTDPFTVYLDADAQDYDISNSSGVIERRILSLDEIEWMYGREAHEVMQSYSSQHGYGGVSTLIDLYANASEIAPRTGFGQYEDADRFYQVYEGLFGELADPYRKTVTVLDFQYWVRRMARIFIDLDTGDRKTIPPSFTDDQIAKVLYYAERMGNNLRVVTRPVKSVRWTTLAGPVMLYDNDRIPYQRFTQTGYFPYFRRGVTRGMIEDLLDSQREVNKRRSATIEVLSKTANGGWLVHENAVDVEQENNIKSHGSTPGVIIKWKGEGAHMKPEQIRPQVNTQRLDRLEEQAENDFAEISGINESAMGDIDKVQSGRAIEARQRQAVISLQMYLTNRNRTTKLRGVKRLTLIQGHYTEERTMRIIGADHQPQVFSINQRIERGTVLASGAGMMRIHDVTVGRYTVFVDETPISATFLNAQFEEALMILEKLGPVGAMLMQIAPDLIVELSSLPRKADWTQALQQAIGMTPVQPEEGGAGVAPGAPAGTAPSLDQGLGPGAEVIPMPGSQPVY